MDMKTVYVNALDKMMADDRRVVMLDADLGRSIGPRSLYAKYPKSLRHFIKPKQRKGKCKCRQQIASAYHKE